MSDTKSVILQRFLKSAPSGLPKMPEYIADLYQFYEDPNRILVLLGRSAVMTIWPNGNHTWHTSMDRKRLLADVVTAARARLGEGDE